MFYRRLSFFEKCASSEVLGYLRIDGEFASQKNGSFIRSIRVLISSGFLCISVLMSGVRLSPAAKAGEGEFSPRLPRSQLVRKVACPEIIDSRPVLRSRLIRLVFKRLIRRSSPKITTFLISLTRRPRAIWPQGTRSSRPKCFCSFTQAL